MMTLVAAAIGSDPRIAAVQADEESQILTPPPAPQPRINGAKVFGVRPGRPLLYTIAATGRRPMKFSAANLPEGLKVDQETGRITGSLAKRGTYRLLLRAENALGSAERELRIVVGDELLLTPLLGCNTWGGWGSKVTDANLRAAAKAMVDTGLIQHGWQYINIDDGWQGRRGGPYNAILPNEKFPDMKALCDTIHGLGLKAGIYSTPWNTSYSGFVGGSSDDPKGAWKLPEPRRDGYRCGKHLFETNDARQWAAWGFDYAKYDWDVDRVELTRRMADALAACDRDIVLELSNSVPLDKAAEHTSLAHLSRTTGDLVDFWDRSGMPPEIRGWAEGVREVWLEHDVWAPFQRPGHWNHACNIRVGLLGGWRDKPLTPTHLTPDEQYTHISLWCLWGSPMIIGTPIERLDPFTLSLLSNDEVLEINQDPLGIQGRRTKAGGGEAVVKPLEDGSKAVGLFNPGSHPAKVSIDWSTLGIRGKQQVRDLWRQKDLGIHSEKFTAEVRPHGVVLVRVVPAKEATPSVTYRCLFNHELLIVCHKKDNSREYIASFIEKLEDTDVDAVMCCPTAWRANVYPSEIDPQWKKYTPEQVSPKFRSFDYIMKYIHSGGDPVKETLDACRNCGKDFFISYRMNDHHYITDVAWPTHNFFWREHPEYWLGDTDTSPYARGKDNARLLNYMIPEVRDYYYSILEELCTNYDVDGVELDFQRFPRFFHNDKLEEGTRVMTAFVQRIGKMLDRIGRERGKSPKLCVRVPQTVAKCEEAGLDVIGWDVRGLVDMINVSSFYIHTMELGIEEFQAKTRRAKIYGEMNYVTYQNSKVSTFARRYTTIAAYRASALNLFHRGADGLSLFNYDYVPSNKRLAMAPGLEGITDVEFLETAPKHYVVSRGFGSLPATNEATINLVVPDDTAKVKFERGVLRVETEKPCADLEIAVRLNREQLKPCEYGDTELFPPLADNAGYAEPETLKFYAVPLDRLVPGGNKVEMENLNKAATSCKFVSLELGLFRPEPEAGDRTPSDN